MSKVVILNSEQISRKITRLAWEVYENNSSEKELLIAGIEGNGYIVAKRLADVLKKISPLSLKIGKIKLEKEKPYGAEPRIDFSEKDFKNKAVVLVDDVLNSGKALIYGVKVFLNYPVKRLNTVVLVDRSHTRYPVKADFVGLSLSTTLQEHIVADLSQKGKEVVYLE